MENDGPPTPPAPPVAPAPPAMEGAAVPPPPTFSGGAGRDALLSSISGFSKSQLKMQTTIDKSGIESIHWDLM